MGKCPSKIHEYLHGLSSLGGCETVCARQLEDTGSQNRGRERNEYSTTEKFGFAQHGPSHTTLMLVLRPATLRIL
jgi:hypothetical protein